MKVLLESRANPILGRGYDGRFVTYCERHVTFQEQPSVLRVLFLMNAPIIVKELLAFHSYLFASSLFQ